MESVVQVLLGKFGNGQQNIFSHLSDGFDSIRCTSAAEILVM